jgi:hypothetical protein
MVMPVLADVDIHVVAGINLAGLLLGILGSLFFTYDLLGRPGGFLRLLLRVGIPALIGALTLGAMTLLLVAATSALSTEPLSTEATVATTLLLAAFGAALGTFNGLFVDAPDASGKRRRFFSLRDAGNGFVVILIYILLAFLVYGLLFRLNLTSLFEVGALLPLVGGAAVGGLIAGVWRFINRSRAQSAPRPHLFSGRGCLIGMGLGLAFLAIALVGLFAFSGALTTEIVLGIVIFAIVAGLPGGGITGGISRYIFWWANELPPRGLEVIGILLILLAFVAQAIEPVLRLFDIAVT